MPFVYTMKEKNRKIAIEKPTKILYNKIKKKRRANAVNFHPFLPDYGILPSAYFEKSAITNPTELFWSDDLLALLRLCGVKEEMIGERASDYDRFLSLSRALPLLEGHPTRAWIASVLEKYFDLKELPTEETASNVWKVLCRSLFENPLSPKDLVGGAWLCDSLTVPNTLPENITPVLDANLLLTTSAQNTAEWSVEIANTVTHFAAHGCQQIVLHLPSNFDFIVPSIYHVDRALTVPKKDREAENFLVCQLMRELSAAAKKNHLLLVLVCDENPNAAERLLQYVKESVGLPRICWSVREAREAHELLNFTAQAHNTDILAALSYDGVMTTSELSAAVESWQMRYPVARLCFVTARDLRQTPFAQAHIANMLKKPKTKI